MDTAVCLFLLVCIFKHGEGWGGRERGWRGGSRQRQRVSLSSGQEKKKFYFLPGVSLCRKARLLPYLGIHSSSYPSCAVILRRLSFHSSFFSLPFCRTWNVSSPLTPPRPQLLLLLRRLVLLAGRLQGDDVCREAVLEQDAPVPLAVQLSDEAVPVDHKARTEPAMQEESALCWNTTAPSPITPKRPEENSQKQKKYLQITRLEEDCGRKKRERRQKNRTLLPRLIYGG